MVFLRSTSKNRVTWNSEQYLDAAISSGNIFQMPNMKDQQGDEGTLYILAQVRSGRYSLVSLTNGIPWREGVFWPDIELAFESPEGHTYKDWKRLPYGAQVTIQAGA